MNVCPAKTQVSYMNLPPLEYDAKGIPSTVNLNSEHTHFILVDDGGKNKFGWGSELQLRAEVESRFASLLKIPIVLVCVQGGPGSAKTIYLAALRKTPVVIIAESGGCSTDIYNFIRKNIPVPDKYDAEVKGYISEIKRMNHESEKLVKRAPPRDQT